MMNGVMMTGATPATLYARALSDLIVQRNLGSGNSREMDNLDPHGDLPPETLLVLVETPRDL